MILALSILAGASVLASTWAYGSGSRWGPVLGLAGQVPWALLQAVTEAHGLWPSWVAMTVIHLRNFIRMGAR